MSLKHLIAASCALLLSTAALSANATNLIVNGSFESSTNGAGQLGYNTNATGWTNTNNGYNFLFNPNALASNGSGQANGVTGQYGNLQLWGPANGSANGLTTSPDGGNFLADDGAFDVGAVTQTVSGLTVGHTYQLSFWQAGAQQYTFNGPTTDQWIVSFGSSVQDSALMSLASNAFSPWELETMDFTASSTSELLSFMSNGTPTGEPPFALLDGVSMTDVPEPSTYALMIVGLLGVIGARKWYKGRTA